jgi:hypothetical protein
MSDDSQKPRYVIADLGFAFAIQDTQVPQDYAFRAGKDSKHLSSNEVNSARVELLPSIAEAVRRTAELNAQAGN